MNLESWLVLLGIVVSAFVAFLNSYLDRRQMRQIELYKTDKSLGLNPPPTRLNKFLKLRFDSILAFGGPCIILICEFSKDEAVNRFGVLSISFSLAMIVLHIVLLIIDRRNQQYNKIFSELLSLLEKRLN